LRDTEDEVEKIGIERTWREIERADVVLLLTDAQHGIGDSERAILRRLPEDVRRISIDNKIDLAGRQPERREDADGVTIALSAKSGLGIELLQQELLTIAGWHQTEDVFIARERHLEALRAAAQHLSVAECRLPQLEIFAEEMRLAQLALNRITGEYTADDLLGDIFGRFCIGK
jgi:tRNA modification GTPase